MVLCLEYFFVNVLFPKLVNTEATSEWVHLPDGTKYRGEVKNGVPEGQGEFLTPEGYRYNGYWKDGKPHDERTAFERAADRRDERIETSRMINSNSTYEGQFLEGKRHGEGFEFSHEWRVPTYRGSREGLLMEVDY